MPSDQSDQIPDPPLVGDEPGEFGGTEAGRYPDKGLPGGHPSPPAPKGSESLPGPGATVVAQEQAKQFAQQTPMTPSPQQFRYSAGGGTARPQNQGFEATEYPPGHPLHRPATGAATHPATPHLANYAAWAEQMNQWRAKYGNSPAGQKAMQDYHAQYGSNPYVQAYTANLAKQLSSQPGGTAATGTKSGAQWSEQMNQWMRKYGKTPAGQKALSDYKTKYAKNPHVTRYLANYTNNAG